MKRVNVFFVFALSLIVITAGGFRNSYSQEKKVKKVPQVILDSFKKAYPNAVIKGKSIEEEEGKTFYEIESVDGKVKRDLLYSTDGKLVEIEETIKESELPDAVKHSIMKEFPGSKIISSEKLTKDGKQTFEIIAKDSIKKYEIEADQSGKILKKESKTIKKSANTKSDTKKK